MDELVRQVVRANGDARGLAVIISNDYINGISNQRRLYGAIKDAEAMRETFKHLNFALIERGNATKVETQSLIIGVANYEHYPKKYDCFVVVFAGHGSGKPMILSGDDEEVDLNEDLLKPLDSGTLKGIPKLIFIDACRVEGDEDHPLSVPTDFLVAYSTRYGHVSTEDDSGGIWMQKLAAELRASSKSVDAVVADVNKAVVSAKQGAQHINTTVDICLGSSHPPVQPYPVPAAPALAAKLKHAVVTMTVTNNTDNILKLNYNPLSSGRWRSQPSSVISGKSINVSARGTDAVIGQPGFKISSCGNGTSGDVSVFFKKDNLGVAEFYHEGEIEGASLVLDDPPDGDDSEEAKCSITIG